MNEKAKESKQKPTDLATYEPGGGLLYDEIHIN